MKLKSKLALFCVMLISLSALMPLLAGAESTLPQKRAIIVGSGGKVVYPDPHETYWVGDSNFYSQIVEALFRIDIHDVAGGYPIIPQLAASLGTWTGDGLNWTIPLREDILFTDGELFNASTVAWNFERLYELDDAGYCQWGVLLWVGNQSVHVPGGAEMLPSFSWEIVSEYEIKLIWPYPRASALGLMAFTGFSFLSPASTNDAEPERYNLVGTGPFTFVSIEADGSRTIRRNDDYWGGPGDTGPADIYEIRWIYNPDTDAVHTGILGGADVRQYDVIGPSMVEYYEQFRADDTLTFVEAIPGQCYFYAGMNTLEIPLAHRKAMAYAFNYTYYIEEFWENTMTYMQTPVSPGIAYAKTDVDIPTMDIARARQFLIDSGDAATAGLTGSSTDQDWVDVAEGSSPIAEYNISHSLWTPWQASAAQMVTDFKAIGIKAVDEPLDSAVVTQLVNYPENFHRVRIFFLGWCPDYLDAHNMLYDAFAGPLALNPMNLQTNPDFDAWVLLLEEAAIETDTTARGALYATIQEQLMDESYDLLPFIHLFNTQEYFLHTAELTNMPYDPGAGSYWYPVLWNPIEPVAIPGYNLIAIFGAIGIAALVLVRKYRK